MIVGWKSSGNGSCNRSEEGDDHSNRPPSPSIVGGPNRSVATDENIAADYFNPVYSASWAVHFGVDQTRTGAVNRILTVREVCRSIKPDPRVTTI
jgi:hypothetical protein